MTSEDSIPPPGSEVGGPRVEPFLGVCDFIAWRLDLFELALGRFFGAVRAEDADARFAVGYRVKDDLALLSVESDQLPYARTSALASATIALPGFHPLRTQLWTLSAPDVRDRGLKSCEVVIRTSDARQLTAAIRGALGMGGDRRAAFRLKVAIPLRIETPGGDLDATTTDLSAGGLFITTQWPLDVGETLPITFFPKSRRPVHGSITVVRHAAGGFGGRVELSVLGQADMYRRVRVLLRPQPAPPLVSTIATASKTWAAPPPPTAMPVARALIGMGSQQKRQELATALAGLHFEVLQKTTGLDTFHSLIDSLALDLLVIDDQLRDLSSRELLFRIRQAGGETDLTVVVLSRNPEAQRDLASASTVLPIDQPMSEVAEQLAQILARKRDAMLE